jgi:hypothetical protein
LRPVLLLVVSAVLLGCGGTLLSHLTSRQPVETTIEAHQTGSSDATSLGGQSAGS